jgi:antitoxin FitA
VRTIATLTIRGLDPETHARLRIEAARHGRSMEAEVQDMLALEAMLALISNCSRVRTMATLTIRGLDPETHARLRIEAARHGRSMEAEVRAILTERLAPDSAERGLGSRIHTRFAGLEGELQLPDRSGEPPRAAVFDP